MFSYNLHKNIKLSYIVIMDKIKVLVISLVFVSLFVFFGIFYKSSCDNDAQRLYNQGTEFYNKADYSNAYYNFKQIKPISNLYLTSLLKQYHCAVKLNDKKTAYFKLKEIIKSTNNPHILPWALYNEALIADSEKKDEKLLLQKFEYIAEKYPQNDYGIAAAFKIAQLSQTLNIKTSADVKNYYIKYLDNAPNGKYSKIALEKLSQYQGFLTNDNIETIAKAYFETMQYDKALEYYKKLPFESSWDKIAKCYKELKNSQEEKKTILKALKLKETFVDEKEFSPQIDRLIVLTKAPKIQVLESLYVNYQSSLLYPTIIYKLAQISSSVREISLYEEIVNKYPESVWASNSLWEVFWFNYNQKRYKMCEKLAKKHLESYVDTQDAPRIGYWYAKTLIKNKKSQQAREAFHNVINSYPLSYYAFLSARALKMSKSKKMITKKQIESYDINNLNEFIFKDKTLLELANNDEWEIIEELKIDDGFIKSWVLNKKGDYATSIKAALDEFSKISNDKKDIKNSHIDLSNKMLKLVFPVVYEDIINKYTFEFEQSPYLFMSLVREESHFNKYAKSSVGALGLGQVMLDTAKFIEKKPLTKENLLDEEENIKIAVKYFDYLTQFFKKNDYLAILSYNAGPGNINKWLNDSNIKSDEVDIFVENIPYLETKNYIKKILSSYWVYINLYSLKK